MTKDQPQPTELLPCPLCESMEYIGLKSLTEYLSGGQKMVRSQFYCAICGLADVGSTVPHLAAEQWNRLVRAILTRLSPSPDERQKDKDSCRQLKEQLEHASNPIHTCGDNCQRPACKLRRENEELKKALSFAESVIKSGEPWTTTCETVFNKALSISSAVKIINEMKGGDVK